MMSKRTQKLSTHPLDRWNETQRKARLKYAAKLRNRPKVKKCRKPSPRIQWKKKAIERAKKIVRDRAKGICERCGKWTKMLHGAHVQSVRHEATAADLDNIIALCFYDHFEFWHKYPLEAAEWFENKWPGRYKNLQLKAQTTPKYSEEDWKRIYQDLTFKAQKFTF